MLKLSWQGVLDALGAVFRARQHEPIERDVAATVVRALGDHDGDVLVFLPGIGEIRRTERLLAESLGPGVDIRPLAGALSRDEQDLALRPSPAGRRTTSSWTSAPPPPIA